MTYGTPWVVWGLKNARPSIREFCVVVFFVCSVLLSQQPGAGGVALSGDVLNLLAFKRDTGCGFSAALSDWNEEDPNPCSWSGVECDPVSLRVVSLKIDGRRASSFCKGSAFAHRHGNVNSSDCGRVAACELSRTLSPAVWKLSELRQLTIAFTNLSGGLSKDVAELKSLQVLNLRSNRFTGKLPSELGKLSKLKVLILDGNAFEGRVPAEISSCRGLVILSLIGNRLSGSISSSLGNLPRLYELSLSSNRLTGPIPRGLMAGECALRRLDLSGNQLSGRIPSEIKSCSKLKWLLLNYNSLHGNIPSELGQLSRLIALEVAGNSLDGVLPDQLGQCSKLEYLVLTSHRAWSSCLDRMESNNFTGAVPPGLARLRNLHVLWAPGTGLSGPFSVSWDDCAKIETVNSAQNALTGEPSSGLKHCQNPGFLDPKSYALFWRPSAASINMTDVNGCQFCGVNFLRSYRSYRFGPAAAGQTVDFERSSGGDGTLPSLRRSMLAPSYEGDALTSTDGPAMSQVQNKKNLNSVLVAAITSGCAIAIVLFVLGIMFQCSKYHRTPRRGPRPPPGRKTVVTFTNMNNYNLTYDNIVKATGNFSIDNLIGGGGFGTTYKAEVKPGLLVAVKRLNIGRFQGVEQFDTEIRTLGRIRHFNLVTLMGYHASHEEMFLIYNYLPRGNLETLIHSPKEQMDWRTRHNIAHGIAMALAFLHDVCVPRVLHRDIKPSNILLDDDMNAHLSDFGLARLLGASETHATTDVAGTFGYVAPEYAMTCRVTDKADVYSYGVVLLELVSGKRALDPSFSSYGNGFTIVSWVCLLIRQGRARDIFTAKLWEEGPEKSLLETLKLAVLCTVDQLSVRPTMKEVVDSLAKCRPTAVSTIN